MNNHSRIISKSTESLDNNKQQQFLYNDFQQYNIRASSFTSFTNSVYSSVSSNSVPISIIQTKFTIMKERADIYSRPDLFSNSQMDFLNNYLVNTISEKLSSQNFQREQHLYSMIYDTKNKIVYESHKNKQRLEGLQSRIIEKFSKVQTQSNKLQMEIKNIKEEYKKQITLIHKDISYIKQNYEGIYSAIRQQFTAINQQFTAIKQQFKKINQELSNINERLCNLEDKVTAIQPNERLKQQIGTQDILIPTKQLIQENKIKIKNTQINQYISNMQQNSKNWSQRIPTFLNAMYEQLYQTKKLKPEYIQRCIENTFNYVMKNKFTYSKNTLTSVVFGFTYKDSWDLQIRNGPDMLFTRGIFQATKKIQPLEKIIIKLFKQLGYREFILNQKVLKEIKSVTKKVFLCTQNLYEFGIILLISIVLLVLQNHNFKEFGKLNQRIIRINKQNRNFIHKIFYQICKTELKYD